MRRDDLLRNVQTKTGSLADGFGGEEWIEYPRQVFGRYPRAMVFYRNDAGTPFAGG